MGLTHQGKLCFRVLSATLLTTILVRHVAAQPASPTLTPLYSFLGSPGDAGYPVAGLIVDQNGTLYGTTAQGGPSNDGTVFELRPPASPGNAWTETVIHSFAGADGSLVFAGLVGQNDRLYGAAVYGGAFGAGTVFELAPPAAAGGAWTESVIYNFTGGNDGGEPIGTLIVDKTGALYGTARGGGTLNFGVVFELMPPASPGGAWTEAVPYNFTNTDDGSDPAGGVVMSESGALYGSASGAIFELTPPASPGGAWTETTIGTAPPGPAPGAGVVIGAGGVLYSTTCLSGGEYGHGSIFELTPPGDKGGAWTETVLYSFRTGLDGGGDTPYGNLLVGRNGSLYGVTNEGGTSGLGVIFELFPPALSGGPWRERVLYNFTDLEVNGGQPTAGLVERNGVFYGTASIGGASNQGTVFELVL